MIETSGHASTRERAVLGTWVPVTLAHAVHELARVNDRTVSAELRRAVRLYVEAEHEKESVKT
jgi:hypothetical protein